jgi:hypothetical protein
MVSCHGQEIICGEKTHFEGGNFDKKLHHRHSQTREYEQRNQRCMNSVDWAAVMSILALCSWKRCQIVHPVARNISNHLSGLLAGQRINGRHTSDKSLLCRVEG